MFSLSAPNKLIVIDHASHPALVGVWLLSADHATLTANPYIMIATDNVGRQSNLELNLGSNLQLGIGMDINAGRAHVLGCS
jgi:hypothetical protein